MCIQEATKTLVWIKKPKCMCYNHLIEYLLREEYAYNFIDPCMFIKKLSIGIAIVVVYTNNMHLSKTLEKIIRIVDYLQRKFEMKDLNKIFLDM